MVKDYTQTRTSTRPSNEAEVIKHSQILHKLRSGVPQFCRIVVTIAGGQDHLGPTGKLCQ